MKVLILVGNFCHLLPKPLTYSMFASKVARLGFFPNGNATTGNRTRVSSVAPLSLRNLIQDALPTELLRLRHLMLIVSTIQLLISTCFYPTSKLACCFCPNLPWLYPVG